jgi:mercuric ion transport protein
MHPAAMMINDEHRPEDSGRAPAALAIAGLVAALAASSCCIVPLALFALGVSGAWIANLTRLAPYQPVFIAAALVCLGGGGWLVHRASRQVCADGVLCARTLSLRLVRSVLIVAALLVAGAIAFNTLGSLILS